MKRVSALLLSGLLAGLLPGLGTAQEAQEPAPPQARPLPPANPFRPFDRAQFEAAAQQLGASAEQVKAFAARADEVGLSRAADDLLRASVPAFHAAVLLHEGGDPAAALELTKVLAAANDPTLRAHVRYHLGRLFLDCDDPEHAAQVLGEYLDQDINRSPLDAEAFFFHAQALAELPLPEPAIAHFEAFLRWFPDAPERFRAAAHQRKGEIERQQESRLHTLADGMKKTTRDLKKQRTGKPTQVDQEHYLEELKRLIEEMEERERQGGGPPSGNGTPSGPATQSALPEGDGSVGKLDRRPSLADRWGDMKDEDREKIEAKVQKGLPPQYQKMLEEYYKKLGKAGSQ